MTKYTDKVLEMPSFEELGKRYRELTKGISGLKKKSKTNTKTAIKPKKGKKSKSLKKKKKSKKN
jgi:hypothetical protein